MRLKKHKPLFITLIVLSAMFISCITVQAQDEIEDSAEINAYVNGKIPSIKATEWTPINVTIQDAFGIDWDRLSQALPEWWMRLIWPFNPSFPQPVQRFLGYTSLRFEPEIIEGNSKGWFLRIHPNSVTGTNPGYLHNITLEAQIDDSAVDYSIVVGIKCTRIDTLGGDIGSSYIYIPVKASPLNFVEMRATQTTKKAGLKSMVYFDVDIINNGYYRDIFMFELDAENGLLGLLNEQALVLNPGETKRVTIGILTPEKIYDYGTPSEVKIYAYSVGDSTRTLVGSLVVITEGFYISPLVWIILAPIVIILFFIYLFFFYFRRRKEKKLIKKPEKPWNIPEEKKHLEKLKNKDKEAYEKELKMMEDEYESALLWYEDYRDSMRGKEGKAAKKEGNIVIRVLRKVKNFFKRKEKPKQPEKEEPKKEIKEEPEERAEIIEKQFEVIDQKSKNAQRKKERALLKIKRQQEKQKRKTK